MQQRETRTVQLIVNHDVNPGMKALSDVPVESSVLIEGTVLLRPSSARRPGPAGEIDVQVNNFVVLNPADTAMPFVPSNPYNLPNEELRLRYRYLDLRRSVLSDNLKKRSRVAHLVRQTLHDNDFVEVETPVLLRSSVEGAREFLVPTRTSSTEPPSFFALQQSPQQPKQLLIASGAVDRYFQLAKCFRDEDGRKDRQPEFTQIDLEMAYVSWGSTEAAHSAWSDTWRIGGSEVRDTIESIVKRIWQKEEGVELPSKFKVMTYHEAMSRFGSDKPDTRFGLEIIDITENLPTEDRKRFQGNCEVLECIVVNKSSTPEFFQASRKCERDPAVEAFNITEKNSSYWLLRSKTLGRLSPEESHTSEVSAINEINEKLQLSPGDTVWLARRSRTPKGGSTALGRQRLSIFEYALGSGALTLPDDPHFLWITEFPLFTRSDDDKEFLAKGRWTSTHHPFTAPMWQDLEAMYNGNIESHYDLVLNGVEIGGGSVRVHDAAMQEHIFTNILKLSDEEKAPFQHLLHALKCGAPPHGGIALGFDRLMSILCKSISIRDVIAFPKTSVGTDLLFKSPATVDPDTLEQYGLQPRVRR
ncbi:aspartate--tRNA ligase msd1 [Paramarasmius palmivorus]|uniref:Aspartate--tRNA ligase msd1 n=1 Tax=Paramarasmius palmivorus TaxID=297713 RepID=A0AAW0EAI5_9AGAR